MLQKSETIQDWILNIRHFVILVRTLSTKLSPPGMTVQILYCRAKPYQTGVLTQLDCVICSSLGSSIGRALVRGYGSISENMKEISHESMEN